MRGEGKDHSLSSSRRGLAILRTLAEEVRELALARRASLWRTFSGPRRELHFGRRLL